MDVYRLGWPVNLHHHRHGQVHLGDAVLGHGHGDLDAIQQGVHGLRVLAGVGFQRNAFAPSGPGRQAQLLDDHAFNAAAQLVGEFKIALPQRPQVIHARVFGVGWQFW